MATVNDIFTSLFPTTQKRLLEPPGSLFLFSFTNVKQSLRCRSAVDRNITHHNMRARLFGHLRRPWEQK